MSNKYYIGKILFVFILIIKMNLYSNSNELESLLTNEKYTNNKPTETIKYLKLILKKNQVNEGLEFFHFQNIFIVRNSRKDRFIFTIYGGKYRFVKA